MKECDIFIAALDKATLDERAAYLDEACGDDIKLRQRIKRLLESHNDAGSLLEHPAVEGCVEVPSRETENHEDLPEGFESGTQGEADSVPLDFLGPCADPDRLGQLGQYEITGGVGRGGMGIVLKGHDTKLDRVVAIKVLAPELAGNPTARRRFLREAQAGAAISHDHVVTIHAVDEDQLPYLVMEFIDGESLQAKIDRVGHLELKEILRIGKQAAEGLAAAHKQGLIHRDIKPANILLENGVERVKITDFGLARAVDDVSITRTGEVTGTPDYMSPEQAEGKSVDHRADLFSLGGVLYIMCTGRSPFRAESTLAVIRRVSDDTPRPIREVNPDIPAWLVEIVDRLLNKNPDERLQSAAEVANLLEKHLAHVQDPGSTPFPGLLPQAHSRRAPRRRWLMAATVLLAVAASLGLTEATGVTQITSTVIRILTPDGTLIVEVDDPRVRVTIEGDGGLLITGAGPQEVRLRPGRYQVRATKEGKQVREELVTIKRGDRQVVKVTLAGTRRKAERAALRAAVQDETLLAFLAAPGAKVDLDDEGRVVSVDLSNTQLTGAELKQLKNLPKLSGLVLNDRQVTHAGLDHVKDLTRLKYLELTDARITDAGLEQLQGIWLWSLYLRGAQITDAGLEHLEGMTNLRNLSLAETRITDAGLKHLERMTSLAELTLHDTQITDAGLEHLKDMTSLRSLNLDNTRITDAGLEQLQGMTWLWEVNLDNTQITDAGLEHLKGLIHLRFLSLNGYLITDVGVAHLNRLATLERLTIWGLTNTKLEHLKSLIHVESLDIPSDRITDAGIVHLKELTYLKQLDLTGTRITAEGVKKLKQALPDCEIRRKQPEEAEQGAALRNEVLIAVLKAAGVKVVLDGEYGVSLDFSTTLITGADLKQLKNLPRLRSLTLNDRQVTNVGLDNVKNLTSLRSLNLSNIRLNDAGLEQLQGMTWLVELNLHGTQITDAGMEHLKGMIHLRTLSFGETSISDAGLEHVKGLTNLDTLELAYTNVTYAGLEHLKGLTSLESLMIHGTRITDAGLEQLRALTNLRSLSLNGNQITDVSVAHLNRLATLKLLTLWNLSNSKLKPLKGLIHVETLEIPDERITDAGNVHLRELTSLKELDLTRTRITAEGVKKLKQALPNCEIRRKQPEEAEQGAALRNQVLIDVLKAAGVKVVLDGEYGVFLDFSTTQITGAELKQLKNLPKLRNLTLNDRQVTHAGLEHVKDLTSLRSMNLDNTRITDAGLEQLQGMTWLRDLNLSGTQIADAGLEHLNGMTNLRGLSLAETRITDAGLEHLKGMTSLNDLALHDTQITDAGLEHLSGMRHLRFLTLNGNQITDVAVAHLNRLGMLERLTVWDPTNAKLEHLKRLIHLNSLEIPGDRITDAGIVHLKELTYLKQLDLTGTHITAEGVKKLKQALPGCEIRAEKLTWEDEPNATVEQETEVTEYDE